MRRKIVKASRLGAVVTMVWCCGAVDLTITKVIIGMVAIGWLTLSMVADTFF